MKYQIYLVTTQTLEQYLRANNVTKKQISHTFISKMCKLLFETDNASEFRHMKEFYLAKYTSPITSILTFNEGRFIENDED